MTNKTGKELNDYKLTSAQVAAEFDWSHKYLQNNWRSLVAKGLPKPKKRNLKSWAWSISEIKDYKNNL